MHPGYAQLLLSYLGVPRVVPSVRHPLRGGRDHQPDRQALTGTACRPGARGPSPACGAPGERRATTTWSPAPSGASACAPCRGCAPARARRRGSSACRTLAGPAPMASRAGRAPVFWCRPGAVVHQNRPLGPAPTGFHFFPFLLPHRLIVRQLPNPPAARGPPR